MLLRCVAALRLAPRATRRLLSSFESVSGAARTAVPRAAVSPAHNAAASFRRPSPPATEACHSPARLGAARRKKGEGECTLSSRSRFLHHVCRTQHSWDGAMLPVRAWDPAEPGEYVCKLHQVAGAQRSRPLLLITLSQQRDDVSSHLSRWTSRKACRSSAPCCGAKSATGGSRCAVALLP